MSDSDSNSMTEVISGYSFNPDDLMIAERRPGISAFMRIRNGEDFLEGTIRSHIEFFDEIVAVHNLSTDSTSDILERLAQEHQPKLRIFHYVDRLFPLGSEGHAATEPTSPHSMVNFSNAAMAKTRFRTVTKLDDDHLAIPKAVEKITTKIRINGGAYNKLLCFSGLNLFRGADGTLGILGNDPVSGGGDIGFFDISSETIFTRDRRFERAPRQGLTRQFCGFLYWHLKYLKVGMGFANYELDQNPNSRYAKREAGLKHSAIVLELDGLADSLAPSAGERLGAWFSTKQRLLNERNCAIGASFPYASVAEALKQTTYPELVTNLLENGGRL
jgi:hypothetical protein